MNVLLINPPFKNEHGKFSREQRSPAVTRSGTFYYPMWLAYATGVLEQAGCTARLIDAPAQCQDLETIVQFAKEFQPSLIVVDTSTPSISNDIAVAEKLKEATGAYIILVGTHPSALPLEVLGKSEYVDAVAIHEYEMTVAELAEKLQISEGKPTREALSTIKGMAFRHDGNLYRNEDRPLVEDVDSFPFVSEVYNRHLNYEDYFYAHSEYPIVTIITGRGCPYQCVYCVYPQVFNGHKMRLRSVKNVVDEIEYILNHFPHVKEIMFEDDTITCNKKRAIELAEEILRRGLKFKWSANSRADIDLETMQMLKKAGARLFCVGIESGDQQVLDNMKKSLKVETIRRFFLDAKKAGILIHGCFLLGNPGETKETLQKTLSLAMELEPDTAQFFPIMVYPGTAAFDWAKSKGYLTTENYDEWLSDEGLHNCVVSRPGLTNKELVDFCDYARRKYYLRPSYILSKLPMVLTNINELKRFARGAYNLAQYIFRRSPNDK